MLVTNRWFPNGDLIQTIITSNGKVSTIEVRSSRLNEVYNKPSESLRLETTINNLINN